MKDINVYTSLLITTGVFGLLWYIPSLNVEHWIEIILIMLLVIFLDVFPIRLMSGNEYSAGTIGTIYLLHESGLGVVAIEIIISTFVMFFKTYGSLRHINWIRYTITISMYFISAILANFALKLTEEVNFFLSVLLTVLTFDLVNFFLIAGVFKSVLGIPIFDGLHKKLRELIIPILISMVVLPRFLIIENSLQFTIEILYTAFFLAVIIFFSGHFMKQVSINQGTNKKFIELFETRTAPKLMGHGARVGEICEILTELFDYPKKNRNTLIQMAIIHDIGKSLIPSHLLQKRGALTLSEEKEYQSHSKKGAEIVESIFPDPSIREWVFYHHERWDGKGFPLGLTKTEIPLEARIISLSNQLDHLMSRHQDNSTVYQLIQEMSGTILDPTLLTKMDEATISQIRETVHFNNQISKEAELISEPEMDAKSHIGRSMFVRYEDNTMFGLNSDFPIIEEIRDLAKLALKRKEAFHETITYESETYEVHFYPLRESVLLFVHDVTPMLTYRDKLMKDTLESYQDVISTLSEEKIQLCLEEKELEQHLGEYVDSINVTASSDVPASRKFLSNYIVDLPQQLKAKMLLAVSEAATNMIKHSTGGQVVLYTKENLVQVLVKDQGSGIPIHEIPKTVLISGYSSKLSLGKGFLLISRSADKVRLYTSSKGTSLLLEFIYEIEDK